MKFVVTASGCTKHEFIGKGYVPECADCQVTNIGTLTITVSSSDGIVFDIKADKDGSTEHIVQGGRCARGTSQLTVVYQSLECEGILRDRECQDCDDTACGCQCHFEGTT